MKKTPAREIFVHAFYSVCIAVLFTLDPCSESEAQKKSDQNPPRQSLDEGKSQSKGWMASTTGCPGQEVNGSMVS